MNILSIILPVFGVIGLGWLARRHHVLKASAADGLNQLVYQVALPFLILQGFIGLKPEMLLHWRLIAVNVLAMAVLTWGAAMVGKYALHLSPKALAMVVVASYFGNTAYIGIPLNTLAYGAEGGALASFIAVLNVLFAVTFGLSTLQLTIEHRGFSPLHAIKHILGLPLIWAALLGIALVLGQVSLPTALVNFIALMAAIAGPLALFTLGMFIHENAFDGKLKIPLLISAFNLLALPAVTYGIGLLLGLDGLPLKISIIQAGMPVAVTTFVFAKQFKTEERHISEAIVLSVLLAPITLSLLLWLVGSM